jgi:hypothetical protein
MELHDSLRFIQEPTTDSCPVQHRSGSPLVTFKIHILILSSHIRMVSSFREETG